MTAPLDTTALILDLRDRMARIETKLDSHYEAHLVIDRRLEALEARADQTDSLVSANASDIAEGKTRWSTLAAIASAIIAILSLLGDRLWTFLSGTH